MSPQNVVCKNRSLLCERSFLRSCLCVCVGCELTNQQPVTPNQLWAVLCLQALSLSPPLPVTLCLALPPLVFFSFLFPLLCRTTMCMFAYVCGHVCVRGRVRPREAFALWPFPVGAMFVLRKRAEMMVNIRKTAAFISITISPFSPSAVHYTQA